jgi:hypothetical protein
MFQAFASADTEAFAQAVATMRYQMRTTQPGKRSAAMKKKAQSLSHQT